MAIQSVQDQLKRHRARIGWTAPGNLHLTLAFLGDIASTDVDRAVAAATRCASACSPFDVRTAGLGAFPTLKRPRILWVGFEGDVARLLDLHQRLSDELRAAGFSLDQKPFKPHLTIGRVKDERDPHLQATMSDLGRMDFSGEVFRVDEVVVMQSELLPTGARYTPLGRATLSPNTSPTHSDS